VAQGSMCERDNPDRSSTNL